MIHPKQSSIGATVRLVMSVAISLLMVVSGLPAQAIAEQADEVVQESSQPVIEGEDNNGVNDSTTPTDETVDVLQETNEPQDEVVQEEGQEVQSKLNSMGVQSDTLQTQTSGNEEIIVNVGLPSEANMYKDVYAQCAYTDDFFETKADEYNDDLAYASVCLASAADNSNEEGTNYAAKAKNIKSFLQQIGCNDVAVNDGYNSKPLTKSNIGVAIGYKDITVKESGSGTSTSYRLFVVAGRGGGYEQEWGVNMRVGESGDALGFQEARDGVISFIMPYIRDNVEPGMNVKIWGSGYCRGGTAVNMALGWLNKWIYEKNNGVPYTGSGSYSTSYNAAHSVYGDSQATGKSYSASEKRYTKQVSFPLDNYFPNGVHFSNDDVYCYAVNCPTASDADDVAANESLMVGFHNLINPDDWFPQFVMGWWGFSRYGYSQDHDITGTYDTAEELHKREKQVVQNTARLNQMVSNLRAIDPGTAFTAYLFRQRYFSKASVATNGIKKVAYQLNKLLPKNKRFKKAENPALFTIAYDTTGAGNKYVSPGKEMAYNQGKYYEEFLRFLLGSAGLGDDDPAINRQKYTREFENSLLYLIEWTLGPTVDARAKFGSTISAKAKEALNAMIRDGVILAVDNNPVDDLGGSTSSTQLGRFMACLASALALDKQEIVSDFLRRTLGPTFTELKMTYDVDDLNNACDTLAGIMLGFYKEEQAMGTFNFYHALTMAKAGGAVMSSHWPQQTLAWFSQFKTGERIQAKPTQELADEEHNLTLRIRGRSAYQGIRRDGDIIGTVALEGDLAREGTLVTSWEMQNGGGDVVQSNVSSDYEIVNTDPKEIVLVANTETLASKHVNFWANVDESAPYVEDQKVMELDIYEGGSEYLTNEAMPDGYDAGTLGLVAYGDKLPERPGFTFGGWVVKADADGNSTAYDAEGDLAYADLPDGETVNLYGIWFDNAVYGVNYHANRNASDTYVMEEQQVVDGDRLGVYGFDADDNNAKFEGHTILSWNTKPDGTGKSFATGAMVAPEELGLASRDAYVNELEGANLNDDATAKRVEDEHTVDLYAQWNVSVTYTAHVQKKGDLPAATDGATAGTTGESKRLEAFTATVSNGSIEYRSHIQGKGWEQSWAADGARSGTIGESRRLEAMQMRLKGVAGQHVWYRVHSQTYGWLGWAKDGEPAGTTGISKRIEAYEMVVLPDGQTPTDYDVKRPAYISCPTGRAHVRAIGWMGTRPAGAVGWLGTTGKSLWLEAVRFQLKAQPWAGDISYKAHVRGKGWLKQVANGATAGTTGESRRIEALSISLTGEASNHLSVWYRVHSQTYGWLGWASDGANAGTSGLSKRAEAVEVQLLPKDAVPIGYNESLPAYRSK